VAELKKLDDTATHIQATVTGTIDSTPRSSGALYEGGLGSVPVMSVTALTISETGSEALIASNEGAQVYSSSHHPAGWEGDVGAHTPLISMMGDQVSISVGHGKSSEHWITAVWALDQTGSVVFWRSFASTDLSPPTASFTLPIGVAELTAYAHCNLHGVWVSSTLADLLKTQAAALIAPITAAGSALQCGAGCTPIGPQRVNLFSPRRTVDWEVQGGNITFVFTFAEEDGFVGIGIRAAGGRGMGSTDMLIIEKVGGGIKVHDYYATSNGVLSSDTDLGGESNVDLLDVSTGNANGEGAWIVRVRRPIVSTERWDESILNETQSILFAFGPAHFQYHGKDCGVLELNLLGRARETMTELSTSGTMAADAMMAKLIHGSFMSMLWGVVTLFGMLAARLRFINPAWMTVHKVLMAISTLLTIPLVVLVKPPGRPAGREISHHGMVGFIVVGVTSLTAILGTCISLANRNPAYAKANKVTIGWIRCIHRWSGYSIAALAVCNLFLGANLFIATYRPGAMVQGQINGSIVLWIVAFVLILGALELQKCRHQKLDQRMVYGKGPVGGNGGVPVRLQPLSAGQHHLFLSHRQNLGQDQVAVIKNRLQVLVPGIRIFLDVDTLDDVHDLALIVSRSKSLLLFLTAGIFHSDFVMQEVRAAVRHRLGIILVRETAASHGAVPIALHQEQCPEDLLAALFGKQALLCCQANSMRVAAGLPRTRHRAQSGADSRPAPSNLGLVRLPALHRADSARLPKFDVSAAASAACVSGGAGNGAVGPQQERLSAGVIEWNRVLEWRQVAICRIVTAMLLFEQPNRLAAHVPRVIIPGSLMAATIESETITSVAAAEEMVELLTREHQMQAHPDQQSAQRRTSSLVRAQSQHFKRRSTVAVKQVMHAWKRGWNHQRTIWLPDPSVDIYNVSDRDAPRKGGAIESGGRSNGSGGLDSGAACAAAGAAHAERWKPFAHFYVSKHCIGHSTIRAGFAASNTLPGSKANVVVTDRAEDWAGGLAMCMIVYLAQGSLDNDRYQEEIYAMDGRLYVVLQEMLPGNGALEFHHFITHPFGQVMYARGVFDKLAVFWYGDTAPQGIGMGRVVGAGVSNDARTDTGEATKGDDQKGPRQSGEALAGHSQEQHYAPEEDDDGLRQVSVKKAVVRLAQLVQELQHRQRRSPSCKPQPANAVAPWPAGT
jgi:desulfoferrodoxin (superoxide reductase-like protein)